ncbi:hypothetical protein ABT081_02630 [Streptomyces sp. NPDC002238]|uniref:hypothetical protein n=1 Tax=Streptomyces sp. NPDC002238 TaxID=3156649 RepID=UPI00331C68F0
MSAQPIEPNPPNTYAITSDNRLAVEALLSNMALPAPTLVARPDAVHVTLADPDDLGQWMYALGGTIRRGIEIDGASLWTLHTETPVRLNGTTVRILVHVPVVSGEDVLAELRTAVQTDAGPELFSTTDGRLWRIAGIDSSGRLFVPSHLDPAKVLRIVWFKEADLIAACGTLTPVTQVAP